MTNKPNAFLLNVEPNNLVFLRTYNTNFVKNYHNIFGSK